MYDRVQLSRFTVYLGIRIEDAGVDRTPYPRISLAV